MNTCVIGLGKLGAPLMVALAARGHKVTGVEKDNRTVEAVNAGQAPVQETHLQELLTGHWANIQATTDCKVAVQDCEIIFVVVPTPSKSHGGFSCRHVVDVAREIGAGLRAVDGYRLIALVSTVMPGHTARYFIPALEETSGKKCGRHFGVCYNPEFIALGAVIQDLLNPDFVLVGESDERAGRMLEEFYQQFCFHSSVVERMSLVNAEITKLSLNCYVTMKISYANMLGELCESIPGANAHIVCRALGRDSRIGSKYLKPGTAYGGPCFPRDGRALRKAMQKVDSSVLSSAIDAVNRRQIERLVDRVLSVSKLEHTTAILGLAYKPETSVVEESAGVALAQRLSALGRRVVVWDPQAMETAAAVLGPTVAYGQSLNATVQEASAIVVMLPHKEFRDLPVGAGATVIDPWGIVDTEKMSVESCYVQMGVGLS